MRIHNFTMVVEEVKPLLVLDLAKAEESGGSLVAIIIASTVLFIIMILALGFLYLKHRVRRYAFGLFGGGGGSSSYFKSYFHDVDAIAGPSHRGVREVIELSSIFPRRAEFVDVQI